MNSRHTTLGLVFFFLYSAVYAAFVLLSAFRPTTMGEPVWQGVNLAVVYGMALIIGAFVLSILYCWLCREPAVPTGETA